MIVVNGRKFLFKLFFHVPFLQDDAYLYIAKLPLLKYHTFVTNTCTLYKVMITNQKIVELMMRIRKEF